MESVKILSSAPVVPGLRLKIDTDPKPIWIRRVEVNGSIMEHIWPAKDAHPELLKSPPNGDGRLILSAWDIDALNGGVAIRGSAGLSTEEKALVSSRSGCHQCIGVAKADCRYRFGPEVWAEAPWLNEAAVGMLTGGGGPHIAWTVAAGVSTLRILREADRIQPIRVEITGGWAPLGYEKIKSLEGHELMPVVQPGGERHVLGRKFVFPSGGRFLRWTTRDEYGPTAYVVLFSEGTWLWGQDTEESGAWALNLPPLPRG